MPFLCDVHLTEHEIGGQLAEPVVLESLLAPAGQMVEAETAIAVLHSADGRHELRVRFDCFVQQWAVEEGRQVRPGSVIVQLLADGETIPEGFAYCSVGAAA